MLNFRPLKPRSLIRLGLRIISSLNFEGEYSQRLIEVVIEIFKPAYSVAIAVLGQRGHQYIQLFGLLCTVNRKSHI